MTTLSIDIETYCDVSLPDVGAYRYATDPSFELLLFAYAFNGEPVQIVDIAQGEKIPDHVFKAIMNENVIKTAFNAQFERVCLSAHFGAIYFGEFLDPKGWHCTMAHALTLGFSGSLEHVAQNMGVPLDRQKLFTGKNLIRLFSIPRKRTKTNQMQLFHQTKSGLWRYRPEDKPEEWEQFKEYCMQDVVAEMAVKDKLAAYPMPKKEIELYWLDQRINDYGVGLDDKFVQQVTAIDEIYTKKLHDRFIEITGVENPNSGLQFRQWLSARVGFDVASVAKKKVLELLDLAKDLPDVTEALQLWQELSKTSVTKYAKMEDIINSDGKARGLVQYYGANRTGRWAGRLVQVQNLPRNNIAELDLAREIVKEGDLETLEMLYSNIPAILSQLIRTAFIPSKGHRFIISDFSAIEARVIAWYAQEQWRLDVFNTHGKIYEASAAAMFGVPVESINRDSPLRQKGKIAELALGYQGSVGALKQMGALEMGLKEEELEELVSQWRTANSNIVQFWHDARRAAHEAIGAKTTITIPQGVRFICEPGVLFVELASGRRLTYPNPKLEPHHEFQGNKITFDGRENGKWARVDTYGGKLVENIVQATARDCLVEAMFKLDKAGYKIAFHVHDEVVLDMPYGQGSLAEVNAILSEPIPWAPGLPMGADGFECEYYQKD